MTQDIKFTATLIRNPKKAKSDDWRETSHEWIVTINDQSFSYYTGLGHREAQTFTKVEFDRLKYKNLTDAGVQELLKISKPTPPKLDDVLHSLVMDADACEMSFDEWCDNFGSSTDSRKALETYLACQENTGKLRKAGIDISAERERLQNH